MILKYISTKINFNMKELIMNIMLCYTVNVQILDNFPPFLFILKSNLTMLKIKSSFSRK